jgi:hypothetical protein
LLGRYTTSCRRHAVNDFKPYSQWCGGFVEDSISSRINLMPTIITFIAQWTAPL